MLVARQKICSDLDVNVLRYPPKLWLLKSKMLFRDLFTWYAQLAQISHVKISYLGPYHLPNFFSSSTRLQLPRNQSSYLPEQFIVNITSSISKETYSQTHIHTNQITR